MLTRNLLAIVERSLAILWGRHDVMASVLRHTGLEAKDRRQVLHAALIEAIARNEVKAVEKLIHSGASVAIFDLEAQPSKQRSEILQTVKRSSQHLQPRPGLEPSSKNGPKMEARVELTPHESWERLFRLSKASGCAPSYFKMLASEAKEAFIRTSSITARMRSGLSSKGARARMPVRDCNEPMEFREMQDLYRLCRSVALFMRQQAEVSSGKVCSKAHLPKIYYELKVLASLHLPCPPPTTQPPSPDYQRARHLARVTVMSSLDCRLPLTREPKA